MRHDAVEIGMFHKAARRRDTKRMMRKFISANAPATQAVSPPTDVLDEAFAGLSRDEQKPNSLAVVSQLAEQLAALDRQREQLARLLRDIEVMPQAD